MSRALGTTDAVTSCDCCGKSGLKLTVAIELDTGEVVHYGTTCASRNTGKPQKQIAAEIRTEAQRVRAAAAAEYRVCPEFFAYRAALARRPRGLVGRAAMEFVEAEGAADDSARARFAAGHGLRPFEIL